MKDAHMEPYLKFTLLSVALFGLLHFFRQILTMQIQYATQVKTISTSGTD